jgi:glycosyltransferase involved in cell wall biosynthesis
MKNPKSTSRPIRAMQSFGSPRPTSNPYIHLLDEALSQTEGIEHIRFNRGRAIFGSYDVLHFHWPETLFGDARGWKALLRRAFAIALAARLELTRVAVVRTVHNIEIPKDATPWEQRYLKWIERRTDHRIALNQRTADAIGGKETTVILHGHYRDWFAGVETAPPAPGTLAFVGLIRRYKGTETLIEAFRETAASELHLRVCGNPSTQELAKELRELAARDDRITLDLRYLSEEEFAKEVTRASGIVLPYRFMHNSGTLLAALSLDRPVLAPRNAVNEELAQEVGDGWISMFDEQLTSADLLRFADSLAALPAARPDLSARGWSEAGLRHREAFRAAILHRRTKESG